MGSMMKRLIAAGAIGIMILLVSSGTRAADPDIQTMFLRQKLGNLVELQILVEEVGPEGRNIGLTREMLYNELLVLLRSKLPRLKIVEGKFGDYLYLNLNVLTHTGGAITGNVLLEMNREVSVLATGAQTKVGVWSKSEIFSGSRGRAPSQVREMVADLVTNFAADYYKAGNP